MIMMYLGSIACAFIRQITAYATRFEARMENACDKKISKLLKYPTFPPPYTISRLLKVIA